MKCDYCRPRNSKEAKYKVNSTYTNNVGRKIKEVHKVCDEHIKIWEAKKEGDKRFKIKIAKYEGLKDCKKCGGTGRVPIPYCQGICFACNGTGKSNYLK